MRTQARFLYALFVAIALTACVQLTPAAILADGYEKVEKVTRAQNDQLERAMMLYQTERSDVARTRLRLEIERAKRVQQFKNETLRVLDLADDALNAGQMAEAMGYLGVVDQMLALLEDRVNE